jgi:ferric-dicitrate binding protein FerR (iron transport regulator)
MTFSGSQRVVELSGEAFFEIAPNAEKPFRVLIKDAEVAVLGTHFNIMAYDDEPVSKTTLIDGAVRMESGSEQVDLHPGQQAEITYPSPGVSGKIRVISGVDPDVVLGWKSGSLDFRNADLYTVMRAVSRCYNVQIHYSQNLPEVVPFTGALKRQDSLSHVLKQLEGFLHLHFNNDGNNVTVTR